MRKLGKNNYTAEFFEIHETKSSIYLVLEYIKGTTLENKAFNEESSENEVKAIMRSILKCIEFCHSKGIFHRDLKLSNLMY
jgi:serine/threonine protein kinase